MLMSLLATGTAPSAASPSRELERLLGGVAAGDRDSLAELYGRTRAAVYGLALSYLKNGQDAQDITQEVFLRFIRQIPTYRHEGKLAHYL